MPAGESIASRTGPLDSLYVGIVEERSRILVGLFFDGDEVGIADNVEDVDDGGELAGSEEVDHDEEGHDEKGVAQDGDQVVDNCHAGGLSVGLVLVDEVYAHLEEISPVEDIEDCGDDKRAEAEETAQPLECCHSKKINKYRMSDGHWSITMFSYYHCSSYCPLFSLS